jgi:hypothetical protein
MAELRKKLSKSDVDFLRNLHLDEVKEILGVF